MRYQPILIAVAVATGGVLPAFLTGGLAVQIRDELGFGAGALGLAVALFFGSSALASVVSGLFVERVGSHPGMRVAAVGSAASLLAVAVFAGSWWGLVVCLVFGGFANAVSQLATNLSVAHEVPPGRQGLAFGIKQSAIPAATLLAGLAVPGIALTLGWRWAFVGAAALVLFVAGLVPREEDDVRPREQVTNGGRAPTTPLVVLALGIGLGSTAATPLGAFVVESAVASGIEVGAAGLLLAFGSAVGITVRVVLGHLVDSMQGGRLRLVSGMLGLGVVAFVLLATGTDVFVVAGTVLGYGAGWGWPGIFNFAIVKSNPGAPAAATGITQTGASLGAAIGPLVFGLVVERASYGAAWTTAGTLALLAALTIAVGRNLLVRERPAKSETG
ncbi:MAG: MFS transporter [Rubrobacter sp.]|nr:MFS transporter [Rubrobacter sp.]